MSSAQAPEPHLSSPASSPKAGVSALDEDLKAIALTAIEAAEDKLGQDSEAFFVGEVLGITDWFVVTSGANKRQVKAIVDNIEEWLAIRHDLRPTRVEGLDSMSWVLMDYGAVVIHVFDHELRSYYELERLWADVPRLVR